MRIDQRLVTRVLRSAGRSFVRRRRSRVSPGVRPWTSQDDLDGREDEHQRRHHSFALTEVLEDREDLNGDRDRLRDEGECDGAHAGDLSVVVVHDLDLAFTFFERVIVVDRGRVVADGPARSLIDDRRIDAAFAVRFDRLKTPDGWLLRAATRDP